MKGTGWELPFPALPRLEGRIEADVCVIGLGGTGLSALRRLQRNRVRRIVGIDASEVASGAAGRNGGFLLAGPAQFHHVAREAWGARAARELYHLTVERIAALARAFPELVDRIGSLRIAADPTEEEDLQRHLDALRSDGFEGHMQRDDRGRAGLFIGGDAVFHPAERCIALADQAWDKGAWLYGGSPVRAIEGTRVLTERGEVDAGAVLVCVDGGLSRLLPELAPRVDEVRLQMLCTAPVAERISHHASYYRNGLDYWQQRPDGRIFLGGCRDLGGTEEEGDLPAEPSERVQAALDRVLVEGVGVRAPVTHRWAGRVAYTADHAPICEEVRPDVWAAGAYSGTGNVLGTLAGEALADAVSGRPEHGLFSALAAIER